MSLPSSYVWPADRVRAWTAAMDAFAAAGRVAVAARSKQELSTGTADALLVGEFADWSIVDLAPESEHARSVAAIEPDQRAAAALSALGPRSCPMIESAMARRTPLVQATLADPAELGMLPDGRPVSEALNAGSWAVAPVTVDGLARGAVTIVRNRTRPRVTFLELSVLAHIADLAAEAMMRLQAAQRSASGTPAGFRR